MAKKRHTSKKDDTSSESDDKKEQRLSVQVLPRRASAKAAADAIRKSRCDVPLSTTMPEQSTPAADAIWKSQRDVPLSTTMPEQSTPPLKRPGVGKSSGKSDPGPEHRELKKCTVKIVRIEDDAALKTSLGALHKRDVQKRIADCSLTVKVTPSMLKRRQTGQGKEEQVNAGQSIAKQRKLTVQLPAANVKHRASFWNPAKQPYAGTGSVEYVMVAPKPGAQIVNWEKPAKQSTSKYLQNFPPNKVAVQTGTQSTKEAEPLVYKCQFCAVMCKSVANLLNHKRLAHKELGGFGCYACGSCFQTLQGLHDHDCRPQMFSLSGAVRASATNKRTSHSVIAVFPDKSQILISKRNLTDNQVGGSTQRASDPQSVSTSSHSGSQQFIVAEPNGKYSNLSKEGSVETATKNKTGSHSQYVNVSSQSKTEQYVIAEPNGKYTYLNKVNVEEKTTCVGTSPGTRPMNFVCESCLAAFPSNAALESHICAASMPLDAGTQNVPLEVEQLARFYSSIVFQKF